MIGDFGRDKARRQSTLSTASLSQASSVLEGLELGQQDTDYNSNDDANGEQRKGFLFAAQESSVSNTNNAVVKELIVSIFVFLMGWYGTRIYFIPYILGGIRERPVPYQVIASTGDVLLDFNLNHPYKEKVIISSWTLIITSTWIPMVLVTMVAFACPLNQQLRMVQVQSAASVVLVAIGISEFITQMIKAFVGRLRPNFYAFCGFDLETKICMASPSQIIEARQSFPSGHSSLTFQGMVVIMLYLVARIGLFAFPDNSAKDKEYTIKALRTKQLQTVTAVAIPLLYGIFVASSRLVDFWHHPSDILAGILIGSGSACLAYHLFYPTVFSKHAGIPYSCFALSV